MCDTCCCGDSNLVPVDVRRNILKANDERARYNRERLVSSRTFAINLMGSVGSGKTALLEATARASGEGWRIGTLAGDLATDNDTRRLRAAGVSARAISTGSACHIDAAMVHEALHYMPPSDLDLLFIENVGNLVCPAIYDLGQAANVVVLSVTEGEDTPLKYPVMFRNADLVVLTKADLLPHLAVTRHGFETNLARVMPEKRVLQLSATTGQGVEDWGRWLEARLALVRLSDTAATPAKDGGPFSQGHEPSNGLYAIGA